MRGAAAKEATGVESSERAGEPVERGAHVPSVVGFWVTARVFNGAGAALREVLRIVAVVYAKGGA